MLSTINNKIKVNYWDFSIFIVTFISFLSPVHTRNELLILILYPSIAILLKEPRPIILKQDSDW